MTIRHIILAGIALSFVGMPSVVRSAPRQERNAKARPSVLRGLVSYVLNGKQRARVNHKLFWHDRFVAAKSVLNKKTLSFGDMRTILKAHRAWGNPGDIVSVSHGNGWSSPVYFTREYRNGDPSKPARKVLKAKYGDIVASSLVERDVTTPRGYSYAQVQQGPPDDGNFGPSMDPVSFVMAIGGVATGAVMIAMALAL